MPLNYKASKNGVTCVVQCVVEVRWHGCEDVASQLPLRVPQALRPSDPSVPLEQGIQPSHWSVLNVTRDCPSLCLLEALSWTAHLANGHLLNGVPSTGQSEACWIAMDDGSKLGKMHTPGDFDS